MKVSVRLYEHRDREAVRYICCETGFMGEPMEVAFEGREVFADMWSRYYTDFEPEHVWVAEVGGKVVGYILGAVDTKTQAKVTKEKILPSIVRKIFTTSCIWSPKTRLYFRRAARSFLRGEFKVTPIARDYPAHLHTNILDGYRGMGLGKAMMEAWLDHLASHGGSALHLETTTYNTQAVPFYERMGFKRLFESPLSMYEGIIEAPVALLGMGMKLR